MNNSQEKENLSLFGFLNKKKKEIKKKGMKKKERKNFLSFVSDWWTGWFDPPHPLSAHWQQQKEGARCVHSNPLPTSTKKRKNKEKSLPLSFRDSTPRTIPTTTIRIMATSTATKDIACMHTNSVNEIFLSVWSIWQSSR